MWTNKNLFLIFLITFFLVFPGCGSGGGDSSKTDPAPQAETTAVRGRVDTSEVGGSGLSIFSVHASPAPVDQQSFSTTVSILGTQLLLVSDDQGLLRALTLSALQPDASADSSVLAGPQILPVNSESTAIALLMLTPGILTTNPLETQARIASLRALPSFSGMVKFLSESLPNRALNTIVRDQTFLELLNACVNEWLNTQVATQPKVTRRQALQPTEPKSSFSVAITDQSSNADVSVLLSNGAWRYVDVWRRELAPGNIEISKRQIWPDATCPMPGATPLSWGTIFTKQAGAATTFTDHLAFIPSSSATKVEYWAAGLGFRNGDSPPPNIAFDKAAGCTVVYYLAFPLIDFLNGSVKLVEKGASLVSTVWGSIRAGVNLTGVLSASDPASLTVALIDTTIGILKLAPPVLLAAGVITEPVSKGLATIAALSSVFLAAPNFAIASWSYFASNDFLHVDIFDPDLKPSLSATLLANPANGQAPLNGVSLDARVIGVATGPALYTFYCNRPDGGIDIILSFDEQVEHPTPPERLIEASLCSYNTPGTYTPKVIVQVGAMAAEARAQVTVTAPPTNQPDVTPPTVISTSPNGATRIAANAIIRVTFSEAMDPATINTTTFTLRDGAGSPVAGAVGLSGATATVMPSAPLAFSTTYTTTITTGAKDLAGNPLAANHTWSFTTIQPLAELIFSSDRDGNWEVYKMRSDGSGQVNLTNNAAFDADPAYSPDGSTITFASARDCIYQKLYVMNSDGTGATRLPIHLNLIVQNPESCELFVQRTPKYSPDGSKIVFRGNVPNGHSQIYLVNSDGSNLINLSHNSFNDKDPVFSRDGQNIVFSSDRAGNYDIYIMEIDGSNPIRLTMASGDDDVPEISPDGSKISFTSQRDGNFEIYQMNLDGSNLVRLTNHTAADGDSVYSSDGTQIVIISNRTGNSDVYLMDSDGTNPVQLTNSSGSEQQPFFRPNPTSLSYPTAQIISPAYGSVFDIETSVTFIGEAFDATGTQLPRNSLVWTSDKDGQVSIGPSFSLSTLSENDHIITLYGTDSFGRTATALTQITVGKPFSVRTVWTAIYDFHPAQQVYAMAADSAGNVILTGWKGGGVPAPNDFLTIKYGTNGSLLWTRTYDAGKDDRAFDVGLDSFDNIFIIGTTSVASTFSADNITLLKYSPDGTLLWKRDIAGSFDYFGSGIHRLAVDKSGDVYITGNSFNGRNFDLQVAKFDSNGNQLWTAVFNGSSDNYDAVRSIVLDSSGDVYVTGITCVSPTSGSVCTGLSDIVTIKYDSAGNQLWSARYDGPANLYDLVTGIQVDTGGNVYLTGMSKGNDTGFDLVTIKYNSNGNKLWDVRYNGPENGDDRDPSIAVDSSGNSYVVGIHGGAAVMIKYSSDGSQNWVKEKSSQADQLPTGRSIVVDAIGNIYITGSLGVGDLITQRYNPDGTVAWITRPGYNDISALIAIDRAGNLYVSGTTFSNSEVITIRYTQ